jgi:hypothetical protein
MKIILIEPAFHFEVVLAYIKMFTKHVDSITVFSSVAVNKYIAEGQDYHNVTLVSKGNQKFSDFIADTIVSYINDETVTILTSNESTDQSFIFHEKLNNAYLLVHNPNFTIRPFSLEMLVKIPKKIPLLILKKIKQFIIGPKSSRTADFHQFSNILLPSDEIVKYCKMKYPKETVKKNIISFPFFGIETLSNSISNQEKIRIVIPGTVENKTRNYTDVIDFLKLNILNAHQYEIILLGMVKEISILEKIKKYSRAVKITYNLSGFDQVEYETHLKEAHLAVLPLNKYMPQSTTYEIQGKTCLSGSINDVCRFGLPFLYNESADIPEILKIVSESYKNGAELHSKIQSWISNDIYNQYKTHYHDLYPTERYEEKGKKILSQLQT